MKLIHTGLVVLMSLLVGACGTLSSPFEGVNDQKVAALRIADTISTKELYGAWAISDEDPINFLYLTVLLPNHSGMSYVTIDEKDGKPESRQVEYYTWEFEEKNKTLVMKRFKRKISENGRPEKVDEKIEITRYATTLYKEGNNTLAVRFTEGSKKITFLKMDNATYQNLVKGVPGLPSLK